MLQSEFIFRNKLARRLLGYFLILAFLPILAFGLFSSWQTTRQMEASHDHYLLKTGEVFNQLFLNRLAQLEDVLQQRAQLVGVIDPISLLTPSEDRFFSRYEAGPVPAMLQEDAARLHLDTGHAVLMFGPGEDPDVRLAVRIDQGRIFTGVVRPEILWGSEDELPIPVDTHLGILLPDGRQLYASAKSEQWRDDVISALLSLRNGRLDFASTGERYYCRTLFLQGNYHFPHWTLVLWQPGDLVRGSQSLAMAMFPLFVALSLGVVLYTLLVSLRRSMTPLSQLRDMAHRIARQDFNAQVSIKSGDEIEELGEAFNVMGSQLKLQFATQKAQAAIDRKILSSMDVDSVVGSALDYVADTFDAGSVGLYLWDRNVFRVFIRREVQDFDVATLPAESKTLPRLWGRIRNAGWMEARDLAELGLILPNIDRTGGVLCSIPMHGQPMGFMLLDRFDPSRTNESSLALAGRTLNQIAVAFANIHLMRELQEFNWGTLEALARAVDEKSSWTQGHSNRVAALAIDLATQMGWTEAALDLLHRAALLHDLGKIGISSEILDKPGRLDEEEMAVIRTHPDRGARILEPVPAYAQVIPIVRHHHERFDGNGYPAGLAGQAIPLGARILTVVDVYDALSSDRPYRAGWGHARACEFLLENAGTAFDPVIVRAFIAQQ